MQNPKDLFKVLIFKDISFVIQQIPYIYLLKYYASDAFYLFFSGDFLNKHTKYYKCIFFLPYDFLSNIFFSLV